MLVLRGRATEYERQVPFQVFTDALAHLDPHLLDGSPGIFRAGGPELRRIQPSMRPFYLEILVTSALVTGKFEEARGWAERAR
jgi:hypothetical protein